MPTKSRTIYTSLYSSSDYVLCISNMKISPIHDNMTEIPPGEIVFRTTNGEEVRYIREEQ
uniref:Uncharacterized protein n=1 Tax=Siphoviridae sp. ctmqu18 TaxID=2825655 RepID=A0A8S5V6J5_9CAUD|nr:MAG TPA: hypothetical protein [Siphoviridae sp. ctmqu18]